MNISVILGSAVIAAIISGGISYFISRQQGKLQYITDERRKWREQIRKIAENLYGATYEDTLKILVSLKVRINSLGNNGVHSSYVSDAHIWKVINEIESIQPTELDLKLKQKQLIEYISLLLKNDWERSKKEVRGNIYEAISLGIFIFTNFMFAISISYCDKKSPIQTFELVFLVVGFFVSILAIQCIAESITKDLNQQILRGYITSEPKDYKPWRIWVCYITYAVKALVLLVIYVLLIDTVFAIASNQTQTQMTISVLALLFMVGMGMRYISQSLNIEDVYDYVVAINKLRVLYESDVTPERKTDICSNKIDVKDRRRSTMKIESTHIKFLEKELGEKDECVLERLDVEIRAYINRCDQYECMTSELEEKLEEIIPTKYTSRDKGKRRQNIENIANYYMDNHIQFRDQELLFSGLSIFSTVLIMVYLTLDLFFRWKIDYYFCAGVFFIATILWLGMDRILGSKHNGKLRDVLEIINNIGNTWIFVLNLFFYLFYALCYDSLMVKRNNTTLAYCLPIIVIIVGIFFYVIGFINEYKKYVQHTKKEGCER